MPVFLASLLAACGSGDKPVGMVGHVQGFAGMVAADEPRAAMVGRDILSAGGSAADAAVAMGFTLAATLPTQVSLDAGGTCLAFDHNANKIETLDFRVPSPAMLPLLPRGLYALYSRSGRLRWEELVSPAEFLARLGFPVSRALAGQSAQFADQLADREARALFGRAGQVGLKEGDILILPALGASLSRFRTRGVGEFYSSGWAGEVAASITAAGGGVTADDLRGAFPRWSDPLAVKTGDDAAYFPANSGGTLEGELWAALARDGLWSAAEPAGRSHLLAEAVARSLADRDHWLNADQSFAADPGTVIEPGHVKAVMAGYSPQTHSPLAGKPIAEPPNGTGLVAVDSDGSAVACVLSLGKPYGNGRLVGALGGMAALPASMGSPPPELAPMMVLNRNSNEIRLVAAAGGGTAGSAATIEAALAVMKDGLHAGAADRQPRLYAEPSPDKVYVEADGPADLQRFGHDVLVWSNPARLNLVNCGSGKVSPGNCEVATDPRGAGLSSLVNGK